MFCLARSRAGRTWLTAASDCDASIPLQKATPVTGRWSFRGGGCGEQRMDALRWRVSHGWLTEPRSNPHLGTTSDRRPERSPSDPGSTLVLEGNLVFDRAF